MKHIQVQLSVMLELEIFLLARNDGTDTTDNCKFDVFALNAKGTLTPSNLSDRSSAKLEQN